MGWVSKKVYAILSSDEEGKKIIEGIGEKDQDTVDKEVDAFFNKTGQSNPDKEKQSDNPRKEEQPKQDRAKASEAGDSDYESSVSFLKEKGYTDEQARGMVKGLIEDTEESDIDPTPEYIENYTKTFYNDGGFKEPSKSEEEKPLHIRSLEKQVAGNPRYQAIADSLASPDDPRHELYFYAFKDAYEKNNDDEYINEDTIDAELGDAYYREMNNYQERKGMSDREFDRYGIVDFEAEYGTEEEFTNEGKEAWRKYMEETYGGRFGGIDEDAQRFGNYILNNPDKFGSPEDVKKYADEFFYSGDEDAETLTKKWSERLFGEQNQEQPKKAQEQQEQDKLSGVKNAIKELKGKYSQSDLKTLIRALYQAKEVPVENLLELLDIVNE